MITDHNILVIHGAEFMETFECIKPCRESGKTLLIQYYKIGHSLSIYLVLFLLTVAKALLLVPIWSAMCCPRAHQQQREQLLRTKSTEKGSNEMTDTSALKDTAFGQSAYDESAYGEQQQDAQEEVQPDNMTVASEFTSGAAYDSAWNHDQVDDKQV